MSPLTARTDIPVLIGDSAAMQTVRAEIAMAARTGVTVLVHGETGTGKEVVARLVHAHGARAARRFVAVNCAGIPETLLESELFGHRRGSFTGAYRDQVGLIQQAAGGTLFLDEVGEMSPRMQAALLRFTETGEIQPIGASGPVSRVEARLITATHRDLRAQSAAGAFREDLYYRLNVLQIHVPPLRARGEDVVLLLGYYLERAAQAHGVQLPTLTPGAVQALLAHSWPGNVRELKNVTERLVLRAAGRAITPDDLPSEIVRSVANPTTMPVDAGAASASPRTGTLDAQATDRLQRLWDRMQAGEDFWTVIHQAFKARELTRADLAALVDRGLRETSGSYRAMLTIFRVHPSEYKRFYGFLYQQRCNLPVRSYRGGAAGRTL